MKKFNITGSEAPPCAIDCLKAHNKYRAIHGSPALLHSQVISTYAQEWADILAKRRIFEHRPDCKYGENLFTAFESNPKWNVRPDDPVRSWYSEIELYTFDRNAIPRSVETGRFTQLIWKDTTKFGVGISVHPSNRVYVVCNYDPPGNAAGLFAENVLPPVKAAKYKHTVKA